MYIFVYIFFNTPGSTVVYQFSNFVKHFEYTEKVKNFKTGFLDRNSYSSGACIICRAHPDSQNVIKKEINLTIYNSDDYARILVSLFFQIKSVVIFR